MTVSHKINARRAYFGAAAIGAAIFAPTVAQAACMLSIEPAQGELVIRHNPLEAEGARGQVEINVVNRGDSVCIGKFSASLRGEQFGFRSDRGFQPIPYQLIDEKGGIDITPRAGQSLRRQGGRVIRLMPGERSLELITVAALPDTSLSQGRYAQTLDLNIVSDDDMLLGSRQLTFGIDIVAAALIGVKGQVGRARGAASVDLGELEKGSKDLPITLYVLSTGGYRVSVSSENQGRLKHQNALWYVDYRLRLGRYDLDLASPDGFEIVSNRARFDNYPVRIDIGETAGKRAGKYMDTVTFTVAAL